MNTAIILVVILRAQFMHRIYKDSHILWINMLMYAMTKIKHVTIPRTIAFKYSSNFLSNHFR